MTAHEILALRPRIQQFLRLFDSRFMNEKTRQHLRVYVQGQLSNLHRKSVEPMALADGPFHGLLDSELFLPEAWSEDRTRCRAAGIPEAMVHRPKWRIGLELYDTAASNGLAFSWVTFDEGYGGKPGFLRGLIERGQRFVGEVPETLTGWIEQPQVTNRPYRKGGKGRPRKVPRLVSDSPRALSLKDHWQSGRAFLDQAWQT